MDISVELVIAVLLGMLALGAPPGLSLVLFRVLMKEGVPLDSQKFHRNHGVLSLIFWPMMFFPGLFLIFFVGNASMADRLQEASSTFEVSLM